MDVRTLRPADLSQYIDLVNFAFSIPPASAKLYEQWVKLNLRYSLGAFDGKQLLGGMWYYPYEMTVGADTLPMGGVAAVATWPEARNRSVVSTMMAQAHRRMRQDGCPLATLRPFRSSYYERMGYAHTFVYNEWEFSPNDLVRPARSAATIETVDGLKEWTTLEQIRRVHYARYTGTIARNKAYWSQKWLTPGDSTLLVYLARRSGQATGYMVCRHTLNAERKQVVEISDSAWIDSDALRALLGIVWSYRDQIRTVTWRLPTDINLFPFMAEQYAAQSRVVPKMMTKLVDVKSAIARRTYPSDLNAEVMLDLGDDPTSTWNTGSWRISWANGRAKASRIRKPTRGLARCTSRTLSVIYMGYQSAEELQDMGLVQFTPEMCEVLTYAFGAANPYMQEWF